MSSLRRHEGYLLIDNRNSPGVDPALVRASGLHVPVVGEGQQFEAPTITCSHCQTQLIVNPARTRERGYCGKCDHYICDGCEAARVATGECRQFAKLVDRVREQALKFVGQEDNPASRLVLTDQA